MSLSLGGCSHPLSRRLRPQPNPCYVQLALWHLSASLPAAVCCLQLFSAAAGLLLWAVGSMPLHPNTCAFKLKFWDWCTALLLLAVFLRRSWPTALSRRCHAPLSRAPNFIPRSHESPPVGRMHSRHYVAGQRPLHVPLSQLHSDSEGVYACPYLDGGGGGEGGTTDWSTDAVCVADCNRNRVSSHLRKVQEGGG